MRKKKEMKTWSFCAWNDCDEIVPEHARQHVQIILVKLLDLFMRFFGVIPVYRIKCPFWVGQRNWVSTIKVCGTTRHAALV
jgi:hypothetical protein